MTISALTKEETIIRTIFEDAYLQTRISKYLDKDLFKELPSSNIVKHLTAFLENYKKFPTATDLYYFLPDDSEEKIKFYNLMSGEFSQTDKKITYEIVEQFIRDRRTYNVLVETATLVHENKVDELSPLVLKLQESVNFKMDNRIGIDLLEDTQVVLDRLNYTNSAIPSPSLFIRGLTGTEFRSGGYMRKALSIWVAQSNLGKSIHLCTDAAYAYRCGYNVLYVTLELAEELITQRIYSDVTDINYKSITNRSADEIQGAFRNNVEPGAKYGNLFVKELPTSATALDIEGLINEIKATRKIDIDLLVVDYIGLIKPIKRKSLGNFNHNTYTIGTAVAEQLRDLGKMFNMAVVTASQINRSGYDTKEVGMGNIADSAGITNTADLMVAITQDPAMRPFRMFYNQVIKNRFGDKDRYYLSVCDYGHMRIRDATNEQQIEFVNSQSEKKEPIKGFTYENLGTLDIKLKIDEAPKETHKDDVLLIVDSKNDIDKIAKVPSAKKSITTDVSELFENAMKNGQNNV